MEEFFPDFEQLVTAFEPTVTKPAQGNPTFPVALRLRPIIPSDETKSQVPFVTATANATYIHKPRKSIRGLPALDTKAFTADFTFGPASANADIYSQCITPLISIATGGGIG